MHKVLFSFLLFMLHVSDLFGSCFIRGEFKNNDATLFVHIFQYRDGNELTLVKKEVNNNNFIYELPENFEEGIYRINVISPKKFSFFDVIVLKKEENIDFEFDISKPTDLPIFKTSQINKDWYLFIKKALQNRKSILELINYKSDNKVKHISDVNSNKAIKNIISEYQSEKKDFLVNQTNPFLAIMIKCINYSGNEFEIQWENTINEKEFLNEVINDNRIILNTPLLKDYIQTKTVYNILKKDEKNLDKNKKLIEAYCELIDHFSMNSLVKKCIIRYAIIGFRENNNKDAELFISNKYNYFM